MEQIERMTKVNFITHIKQKNQEAAIGLLPDLDTTAVCDIVINELPLLCYTIKNKLSLLSLALIKTAPATLLATTPNDENALFFISKFEHKATWEAVAALEGEEMAQALYQKNKQGRTPLHLAALYNQLDTIRFLCHYNPALLYEKDNEGNTPLHLAIKNKSVTLILFFAQQGALLPEPEDSQKEQILTLLAQAQTETPLA